MPATAYVSAHGVERFQITRFHPNISNAVEIHLVQRAKDGKEPDYLEITVYGLPDAAAEALVKSMADAETKVCTGKDYMAVTDYLVAKGVFDAIEGK